MADSKDSGSSSSSRERSASSSAGLIVQVANYCWSHNFLTVFTNFFRDHAEEFIDAPPLIEGGEHDLKYYALFQKYLKIYEGVLTEYIETLDCSIEDFYREVRDSGVTSDDPYLQKFVECLLASAEYPSFYKVMSREGRRLREEREAAAENKPRRNSFSEPRFTRADSKVAVGYAGAKWEGDAEFEESPHSVDHKHVREDYK